MKGAMKPNRLRRGLHKGMAVVELMIAIGLLFTTAWAFLMLGAAGCQAYFELMARFVLLPLS